MEKFILQLLTGIWFLSIFPHNQKGLEKVSFAPFSQVCLLQCKTESDLKSVSKFLEETE